MSLIGLLVVAIIFGVLVWAVMQLPIDPTIKRILHVVLVVLFVLWLLQALGLLGGADIVVPRGDD